MRGFAVRFAWLGIAAVAVAAASSCAPVERNTTVVARATFDTAGIKPVAIPEFIRVDPEEAAERAFVGGLVGGMMGAGVGAIASPNPAIGAIIGGSAGAALGTAIGVATTPPLPGYMPIAVPTAPVIPGFYDTWPPGYAAPPAAAQAAPPPPDWYAPLVENPAPGEAPPSAAGAVPPSAPL